jgi:hypothetical protein
MIASPVVALIAIGSSSGTPFVLTAIVLALTVAGPLLVSNRLAEPNDDVMLSWDPDALPDGWEARRGRYFALNWIRFLRRWRRSACCSRR